MPLVDANFFNVFCVVEIYSNHTLPLIFCLRFTVLGVAFCVNSGNKETQFFNYKSC